MLPPTTTEEGDTVNDTLGDELGDVTVRVADAETVPPAPVQLTEYVVVCDGETDTVPAVLLPVAKPVPVHVEALVELHVSAEEFPLVIVLGESEIEAVGGVAVLVYVNVYFPD